MYIRLKWTDIPIRFPMASTGKLVLNYSAQIQITIMLTLSVEIIPAIFSKTEPTFQFKVLLWHVAHGSMHRRVYVVYNIW
jgi:hypothetical protein